MYCHNMYFFLQLHQQDLDAFRDQFGESPVDGSSVGTATKESIKAVNERFHNLKTNSDDLTEQGHKAAGKHKQFQDTLTKMHTWLQDAEKRSEEIKEEPVAAEPKKIEVQLDQTKTFGAEAISHGKQAEELKRAAKTLTDAMKELGADDDTLAEIEKNVEEVKDRLGTITHDATEKANVLQTALVQAQGVQKGLDGLQEWLEDAERKLDQMKAISLSQEGLSDQIQELQLLKSDVESHIPSVDALQESADDLKKSGDPKVAEAVQNKLDELRERFGVLANRCKEREEDLLDVTDKLGAFEEQSKSFEDWLIPTIQVLDSKDTAALEAPMFQAKIQEIRGEAKEKGEELEKLNELAKTLIADPKTTETEKVRVKVDECARNWSDFMEVLIEREHQAKQREQQATRYHDVYAQVIKWLEEHEDVMDKLEAVAIDMEVIEKQIEEIEPLLANFEEFEPTMDEITLLGNSYDALQRGVEETSSPVRRSK